MNLILASKQDAAGMNIADNLIELYDFDKIKEDVYLYKDCILHITKTDSVYTEYPEKNYDDIDFIIFASRHSSEAGVPSLTAHTPGNFGSADYGGHPEEICISNPVAQKLALKELHNQNKDLAIDFEVSMEATHHGPLTGKPTMFIEIGSQKEQWINKKAGEAVAVALMKSTEYPKYEYITAVGVGGGHYCPKHTRVMLYREYAIGHVLAKYVQPTKKNVKKAIKKNMHCDAIIMDWKGTPKRSSVREELEEIGLPIYKAKKLLR
jgi:D-aminoacyl-tRNA deacylase